ncbi:MAG: hypothetical protein WAX89_06730 [Alphaproteobacteria bacterium]
MMHHRLPTRAELGPRICVMGRSNSGKSTLAVQLAELLHIPVFHLDQMAHFPNTRWERRPNADFMADHNALLVQEAWMIEGNYGKSMPQRFARATSVIWCDIPLLGCLWRYAKRSWKNDPHRAGGLAGSQGEFSWGLVRYMSRQYPMNREEYMKILDNYPSLPVFQLSTFQQVKQVVPHVAS